jgi:hypothetical protein
LGQPGFSIQQLLPRLIEIGLCLLALLMGIGNGRNRFTHNHKESHRAKRAKEKQD